MKESKLLYQVANDISWMKEKQLEHDSILLRIKEKLDKGTNKIAENREGIKVCASRVALLQNIIFGVILAGIITGTGILISRLI